MASSMESLTEQNTESTATNTRWLTHELECAAHELDRELSGKQYECV